MIITGTNNGLGKYLLGKMGGIGITRETTEREMEEATKLNNTIIHCAFDINEIDKHLRQTETLAKSDHENFVYISSVDVYPESKLTHIEGEDIVLSKNRYGEAKYEAENIVWKHGHNPLILRCSGLLGPHSKKNNLLKLIRDETPKLTLTPESKINVVSYEDVFEFIDNALKNNRIGVYNIASSKNISIKEVADKLTKNPIYGFFKYDVGKIDNMKAREFNPNLAKSSWQVIEEYLK